MLDLAKATHTDFEACLREPFELITGTGAIELTLAEVRPLNSQNPGAGRVAFALTFHGAPQLRLPQHIYRLQNLRLGPMEIFLVQLGADHHESRFEAVFN